MALVCCRALLQPRVGNLGGLPDMGRGHRWLQHGAHAARGHFLLGIQRLGAGAGAWLGRSPGSYCFSSLISCLLPCTLIDGISHCRE